MEAAPHPQQSARLAALHSYEVLDTDPEQDFDDIVNLAAATCGTAISVVNFIDAERQWFKAETGLGVRETPLATSICSHVILEKDFVEIHDTLDDPRMKDNPLCCGDPGLRFYAGALLRTEEGLPLGTLCVLDHQPRELTALQRDTLRVLARQVMAILEARKALRTADILGRDSSHRIKNILSIVQSLANMTKRHSPPERAMDDFSARLDALSAVHQIFGDVRAPQATGFEQIARQVLQPYLGPSSRVSIRGDCPPIRRDQAKLLGLCLHELATNSVKYGALSRQEGHIEVFMVSDPGGLTEFRWSETFSHPNGRPSRSGYGTTFIRATLEQLIGGAVETGRCPDGFLVSARGSATGLFG